MVRPATAADRGAVEDVVRAAYAPWVARIGRAPAPMGDDYGALIRNGVVHVAECGGAVRGVLVLMADAGGMLLDNVAVHPDAQGTGVGRALLDFAEAAARRAGSWSIRLYTNAAMVENVRLYARRGYVETHRGEEHGFDRVYMAKPLA